MFENLSKTIQSLKEAPISTERKEVLQPLVDYILSKLAKNETINLNFICTHNSRRSHLSQVWAQTMAFHFGLKDVFCYSGGTEATALFPKVAETLANQGFEIQTLSQGSNPVYALKFDPNQQPVIGFSKNFDDAFNPISNFAAIMTCSSADEGCPFIAGAEKRLPVRYEDPKIYDGTDQQDSGYAQRSLEIAAEMHYVFSQIKK